MAEFQIQIAGQVIRVLSLFDSTRDYCRCYLTEAPAETTVTVSHQEMEAEQAELNAEAVREGIRLRKFSDPFLERSVIQRKVADHLLGSGVLLFHGSAVAVDGEGYLFTADCGTGKSTHTRLWRQVFRDRAVMINDDKPFLKLTDRGVLICGAPWSGKHGLDTNITVPLKGICILTRGAENRIRPMAPEEALPMLEKQSGPPGDPAAMADHRALVERLSRKTAFWQMECNKEPEAAQVAYCAMSEKGKKL